MAKRAEVARGNTFRIPAVTAIIVYCLLLLCIPSQLIVGPIGAPGTPANLWGILALIWWVCATLGGINPAGRSPVRTALAVLAIAVLSSYAAAMIHGWYAPPDIHGLTDEVYDLVPTTVSALTDKMISAADRGLLSFAGWSGIVLLTVDGIRSWRDLQLLFDCLAWAAAFVGILGIIQFFTGVDIASFFRIPGLVANSDFGIVDSRSVLRRVAGTAVHPIEFGVVLSAIFPLALHRLIFSPRNKWRWIPVLIIGIAIPLSVSRSAILVLGLGLIILLAGWPPQWRLRALIIAPLAMVLMRLAIPGLVGTIIALFTNFFDDPSISGRTDDYDVVFDLYGDHEWLGRGLFTFIPRYYRVLDNQFLMSLVELGVLGLLALITFFLVGFYSARSARRMISDRVHRDLCLSLSAAIAGIVVSYLTFDAWSFPMAAGMTFLLVGMAGAAWRLAKGDLPVSPRTSSNSIGSV